MNDIEGSLKVWWVPQIPMKAFEAPVASLEEAIRVLDTLANYDIFQFENKVKPDYCNVGGLLIFEEGEWINWYDPETYQDIDEYRRARNGN